MALKLENIQGNILAGFNKDHQRFLFIGFPEHSNAKRWLEAVTPELATSNEVNAFNILFREVNARRGSEQNTVQATWSNLALSASGLTALGAAAADVEAFPEAFRQGMKARAAEVGDTGENSPEKWVEPLGSTSVHALMLLAADSSADLDAESLRQIERLSQFNLELLYTQDGKARSDLPGHEHFGFKDGVSQPGIREFTEPTNPAEPNQGQPGQDLLWAGEFVLGYPTQKKPPAPPTPIPSPPYGAPAATPPTPSTSEVLTEPGEVVINGPHWAADGSYLVFRRLRQDVAAFNTFVESTATSEGRTAALIGAKLVGRYESGCPLEPTAGMNPQIDTQAGDPSFTDPTLLEDAKINDFEYRAADADGHVVPHAAHIRKVYPRDEATPGGGAADTQTHRLLRRGIAFGEPYSGGAQPGSPQAGDAVYPNDRGLLFLCYQRSLEDQFELVQSRWVNNPDFPEGGDGQDPVIAQEASPRSFRAEGLGTAELTIPQFVTTTGGEYFFSPSISALQELADA